VTGYQTDHARRLEIEEVKVADEPVRDEAFWRMWAEETRRVAEAMTHPSAKHQMHLIAEDYERLAKVAQFPFPGCRCVG
jgi:hypothetical protein